MKKPYTIIPHTADLKLKITGATMPELFRNALIGMFQSIKPYSTDCIYRDEQLICPQLPIQHTIDLSATASDLLLVDFLSEALYLSDVNNEAFLDVDISMPTPTSLTAILKGVSITGFESAEIKAVTFNELSLERQNNHWQAIVVFDI